MSDDTPTTDLGHISAHRDGDVVIVEAPPRRRRRWLGWVIALVVIVVLVVVGWIVGDIVARDMADRYVRDQITQVFDLKPDAPMTVTIGEGSLIAQAITGGIDSVDVMVPDVSVGEIAGDVSISLTDIPLQSTQPVGTMNVTLSVPEENLAGLGSYLSGVDVSSITLVEDRVAIATQLELFGFPIPIGIQLTPEAKNGEIGFTPSVIELNGANISVPDLLGGPLAGIAGSVLATQSFCVAEYLPEALTVTSVDVVKKNLVVALTGDGKALGGPEFSRMGTCAS
ncbi:MAG: DUF2993 domain-containing protein [Microbacteriaceae bacterium]